VSLTIPNCTKFQSTGFIGGWEQEIKDKTLSIRWGELLDFTAKTKADFALRPPAGETGSAAYSPRGAVNSEQVTTGALCLKMREPFLSETDASSRHRSLTLASQVKTFSLHFLISRAP
jgi:hypothetical protein